MWCTWLLPLLLLLGAALIGGLIGWLMRGNKIQIIKEEYESRIKSSEKIIANEQAAGAALQSEYDKLEQEGLLKETRITTLESDLLGEKKESAGNKSGWDAAVLSLGVLQTKYDTKEKEHDTLVHTVAGLEQALTEKQEKIVTIESDFRNWKNESLEKTTALSKENDGLNEKIRNLEGELADKNNQWSEAKTRYETEVNDLGDIIEDQKIELNTWIKKYNQLSEDKELAIKNYQLLEETTKVEVASLKGEIEKEQSTNTSLQEVSIKQADRIKELEDQLVSAEEKSSTNKIGWDAAVMSLGVLQGKYDTKEKDYNDLYNEVTSLKEELTEEQDKIVAIETNFSAWKEESIAKTTTLKQENSSLNTQVKELEDQLVSAEEKSSTNKIGWDTAVMSLGVLQGKYDMKEKDYNDLYNEVTSLKEELTEEQDKIVAIETNFSAWKKESTAKITTLTQEKASLTEKVTDLGVTITKHKIKIDELEKIKDKHLVEISTWHKKYNQLSRDKEVVAKNYQLLEEKIKVDIEGLEGVIEQEKSINLGLKSSNDQLQEKTNQQTEKIIDLESRLEKLEIETAERIATITNDFSTKNVAYQKEIEELEEIIEDQMHQKERNSQLLEELRVNLTKVKKEKDLGDKEIIRLQGLLAKLEKEQKELDAVPATPLTKEEVTLQRIKEKAQQIDFGRIGVASYADRDDLKKIKGIGVFIEKKLYALGIYTFWQIANLSLEDEEKVNQAIEFFPGRIRRDEWVRQGGELHKEKEDEKEENK